MTVKRMENSAIEFFTELGSTLEGRVPIEGEWAGHVTGAKIRTPVPETGT